MTKEFIAYYTSNRTPLSLRNLQIKRGYNIEDIFDAVEDSTNFDELTDRLLQILNERISVSRIGPHYIRYQVTDFMGNISYLKIKITEE